MSEQKFGEKTLLDVLANYSLTTGANVLFYNFTTSVYIYNLEQLYLLCGGQAFLFKAFPPPSI